LISANLADFIQSGGSVILGTRDDRLFGESVRAVGVKVSHDRKELTLFIPCATSSTTCANLQDNGRAAVCFARIQDHRTLQIKGALVELRDALPEERRVVEAYRSKLAENLAWVGVPPRLSLRIAHWPCHAVRIRIESVFDQTPGPRAGEALRKPEQGVVA
jgi:hypothetical protein